MKARQRLRNAVLIAVSLAVPFAAHMRMAMAQSPSSS